MPGKQRSCEEWEQEQRERDPRWDRWVRDFQKVRGPKRKVPLLLDENLEAEIIGVFGPARAMLGRPRATGSCGDEARRWRGP